MKSILGLAFAAGVVLAFGIAWRIAARDGTGLLDQQWLFLVALPYNLSVLQIFGDSDFSPDAPSQVVAAGAVEAAVAYLGGAVLEAAFRGIWRALRRISPQA